MKTPEFIKVKFRQLRPWDKNPRMITKKEIKNLAEKLKEKGVFKNFVCWQDGADAKKGVYTVGGGNMRFYAMKDVLKVGPDSDVWISLNYPASEKEKVELSLLDNMTAGSYVEQQLAELLFPYKDELNLETFKLNFSEGLDLKRFLDGFGPSDLPDIEETPDSDRRTISIVCRSDDEVLEMRKLFQIEDRKTNRIEAEDVKRLFARVSDASESTSVDDHKNVESVIRYYLKFVPPKGTKSILDIGAGRSTPYRGNLRARCDRYVAFDLRSSPRIDVVGDARKMDMFKDREFEWGWATEILEHFDAENQKIALDEWLRVCKNLIITFPKPEFHSEDKGIKVGSFFDDPGHHEVVVDFSGYKDRYVIEDESTKTGRAIYIFKRRK